MKYVYLSHAAHPQVAEWIEQSGRKAVATPNNPDIYAAVCSHADLVLCPLPDGRVVKAPLTGPNYPDCAALCAVVTEKYFIHNIKITDPSLLQEAEMIGCEIINVRQGFTRCNLLPVGNGFITQDMGIYKALKKRNIDVLLVSQGDISLPGHNHGFIGGCGGAVGNDVVFNGDITLHPNHKEIAEFIKKQGFGIKYFSDLPLVDIGSILQAEELVNLP